MDPTSLISCCYRTVKGIKEIRVKCKESSRTLASIETQCRILETGIRSINNWSKANAAGLSSEESQSLNSAIDLIQESMNALYDDIQRVLDGNRDVPMDMGDQWAAAKYVWNEQSMKTHLVELREHVILIQFTLQVLQLQSREDNGRIFQNVAKRALTIRRTNGHTSQHESEIQSLPGPQLEPSVAPPSYQEHLASQRTAIDPHNPLGSMTGRFNPTTHMDFVEALGLAPFNTFDDSTISHEVVDVDESTVVQNGIRSGLTLPKDNYVGPVLQDTKEARTDLSVVTTQDASEGFTSTESSSSVFNKSLPMSGASSFSDFTMTTSPSQSTDISSQSLIRIPPSTSASTATTIRRKPLGTTKSSDSIPSSRVSLPKQPYQQVRMNSEPVTSQWPPPVRHASPVSTSVSAPLVGNTTASTILTWTGGKPSGNSLSQTTPVNHFTPPETTYQPSRSDINEPDDEGYPPIVKAAGDGLEDAVVQLLSCNAYIEAAQVKTNRTALLEASRKGHRDIVDLLLRHGSAVNHIDASTMTALHYAASEGHCEVAKRLLDNKATVDAKGPEEQTPLHLAAGIQHSDLVALLVQRQADINAKDESQQTSLHISASCGNSTICKLLLENGAQLEIRDAKFKTALQLAIEAGHVEVVELFLTHSSLKPKDTGFRDALFTAVEAGQTRLVQSFFDKGASLKGLGSDSYKAITSAAKGASLEMLELMIQKKCKIKEKDANGWTALHFAAHHGHTHIVERLIEKGVSIKAITSKKETPLHLAVKAGHQMTTKFLLRSKGVSVDAKDMHGQEALHFAVRGGFTEIVNMLVSKNANINAENAFGWRPLHIAAAYGHMALVVLFTSRGANIEEKLGTTSISKAQTYATVESGYWAEARWPYPGSRPLHLSIEYGHEDITRFLIGKKSKVESHCSEGWRPLHHAAFNGSPSTAELLLASGAYVHALTYGRKTPLEIGFRTGGAVISETDKLRVQELLQKAGTKTPRQRIVDQLKNGWGFHGKSVEERNDTLKSADLAIALTAKCAS